MDGAAAKEYGDTSRSTSNDKRSDYAHDMERATEKGSVKPVELKRKLQSRHIQMIGLSPTRYYPFNRSFC